MKRLLVLIVLFMGTLGGPAGNPVAARAGMLPAAGGHGKVYTCKFFGYSLTVPPGWTAQMAGMGSRKACVDHGYYSPVFADSPQEHADIAIDLVDDFNGDRRKEILQAVSDEQLQTVPRTFYTVHAAGEVFLAASFLSKKRLPHPVVLRYRLLAVIANSNGDYVFEADVDTALPRATYNALVQQVTLALLSFHLVPESTSNPAPRAAPAPLQYYTCATQGYTIGIPKGWQYDGPDRYDHSFSDGCSTKDGIGYRTIDRSAQVTFQEDNTALQGSAGDNLDSWVQTFEDGNSAPSPQTETVNGVSWAVVTMVSKGEFGNNLQGCTCYALIASTQIDGGVWTFVGQVRKDLGSHYVLKVGEVNATFRSIVLKQLPQNGHLLDVSDSSNNNTTDDFRVSGPFTIEWAASFQDVSLGSGYLAVELYSDGGDLLDLVANTTTQGAHVSNEQADCSGGCFLKITADNMVYHVTVDKGDL